MKAGTKVHDVMSRKTATFTVTFSENFKSHVDVSNISRQMQQITCDCTKRYRHYVSCSVTEEFGRSLWPRGLRRKSTAARLLDCGFESRRGNGCLYLENAICCQVEISARGRSLAQRSPIKPCVIECDQV